jgi:hypothetical protein
MTWRQWWEIMTPIAGAMEPGGDSAPATCAFGVFAGGSGRVNNPPQVSNLPHSFRRILKSRKSTRHWAGSPLYWNRRGSWRNGGIVIQLAMDSPFAGGRFRAGA